MVLHIPVIMTVQFLFADSDWPVYNLQKKTASFGVPKPPSFYFKYFFL